MKDKSNTKPRNRSQRRRKRKDQKTLKRLIEINPDVKSFMETFDLEIEKVER